MNPYPYHSNSFVAPVLLVLIVVCIAGAVLANSEFLFSPEARSENLVSTASFRPPTLTALANKSAQEAGIAGQTQVAQQLTALPPAQTLQAAVAAPALTASAQQIAAQTQRATSIVLMLLAIAVPGAVVALFALALNLFRQDMERKYQEARARERQAEAAIAEQHNRWKQERDQRLGKRTQPNHLPVSDGGHKTSLSGDSRNLWPDNEETRDKRDLPWVE